MVTGTALEIEGVASYEDFGTRWSTTRLGSPKSAVTKAASTYRVSQ